MKLLKLFFFHFFSCILLFLSSCGLDEYYEINAPYIRNNDPDYETEYDNRFFSFVTNDSDSGVEAGAGGKKWHWYRCRTALGHLQLRCQSGILP